MCAPIIKVDIELQNIQAQALSDVSYELIRQVTSPTDLIREQVMLTIFYIQKLNYLLEDVHCIKIKIFC